MSELTIRNVDVKDNRVNIEYWDGNESRYLWFDEPSIEHAIIELKKARLMFIILREIKKTTMPEAEYLEVSKTVSRVKSIIIKEDQGSAGGA